MTERLSKAERDVCRKRWEHPCDLEPERHACTIIDLLNDLDALERERDDLKRQLEELKITRGVCCMEMEEQRDALATALRGLREAVRHMDIACATDDPLGVVQVNACNEADDALRDAEGSDEEV